MRMTNQTVSENRIADRFNTFANGENAMFKSTGGLFYCTSNKMYMENLARIYRKVLHNEPDAYEEFKKVLKDCTYEVKEPATYDAESVLAIEKPIITTRNLMKKQSHSFHRLRENQKFNVKRLVVNIANPMLMFMAFNDNNNTALRERERRQRKELLELWLSLTKNATVKEYLEKVKEWVKITDDEFSAGDEDFNQITQRLFSILLPVDFTRLLNDKTLISAAHLIKGRYSTTVENLFNRLEENRIYEDYEACLKSRGKSIEEIKELAKRVCGESETVKNLYEDWKKFILKLINGEGKEKITSVSVSEGSAKAEIPYGEILTPLKDFTVYIYYDKKIINKQRAIIKKQLENQYNNQSFIHRGGKRIKIVERELESLFGGEEYLNVIKTLSYLPRVASKDTEENSIKYLFGLLNFYSKAIKSLQHRIRNGELCAYILALDCDENIENIEKYPLWDYVDFMYTYSGLPIQTVTTKKFLQNIETTSVVKNTYISLLKDCKEIRLNLNSDINMRVFWENPSPNFFYEKIYHSAVTVYRVTGQKVWIEDKFMVMGDKGNSYCLFKEFVNKCMEEKNISICAIGSKQFLADCFNHLNDILTMEYEELVIPYFSKKGNTTDCYVIYPDDFKKIIEGLGIPSGKWNYMAIKPRESSAIKKDYYHTHLQLFSTDKEITDTHILALVAISMLESESVWSPVRKLLTSRNGKGQYIQIQRGHNTYYFPVGAVVYELIKFMEERPYK